MSGLSREVLKWIQGLDLSYSVRNVRRDFSNGFMFAEILSRYYPHDIEMHSFDNGSNNKTKQDNWNQLKKFFHKIDFEFTTEEIENIIKCDVKSQSVKLLINRLYQAITNKKLREAPKLNETKLIPPYAFNTASKTVTEKFRGKDMDNSDINATKQQAQSIINQHQELQLEQKKLRGNVVKKHLLSSTGTLGRVAPRGVSASDNDMQNVSFIKEVEVKKVNESLLTLRNSTGLISSSTINNDPNDVNMIKQSPVHNTNNEALNNMENMEAMTSRSAHMTTTSVANNSQIGGGVGLLSSPSKYQHTVIASIDEIFRNCIQFCIRNEIIDIDFFATSLNDDENNDDEQNNGLQQQRKRSIISLFFEMFYDANNTEVVTKLIGIIQCMQNEFIPQFCQSAICSPKDFWRIMNIICKGFDILDESSILFDKWLVFAKEFVNVLTNNKSSTSNSNRGQSNIDTLDNDNAFVFELFCDFGLKSFINMLSSYPSKRKYIFQFIQLFLNNDEEEIIFLKKLQKELNSMDKFIENCAIFVECDAENIHNKQISQQLMDVYIYYSISGLNHCSPKTRAASLSILSFILEHSNDVINVINKTFESIVMNMIDDRWWEVHANLIMLCCNLLSRFNYRHPISTKVYQTLNVLLNDTKRDLCPKVIKIALYYLSSVIEGHKPMYQIFTSILLRYDHIRAALLGNKQFMQYFTFSYGKTIKIECICLQNSWQGWIPCLCVAEIMRTSKLGNFLPAHLEIILGTIGHLDEFPMEQSIEWKQVFMELKDYLLVELCDPSSCISISQCLLKFIYDRNISEHAIQLIYNNANQTPPLFGVLKLVFDTNSPQLCQQTLLDFLSKLLNDNRFEKITKNLLQMFYTKYPIQFLQSSLSNFKDHISIKQ